MRKKVYATVLFVGISFKEDNDVLDSCISPYEETQQAEQNNAHVFNHPDSLFEGH